MWQRLRQRRARRAKAAQPPNLAAFLAGDQAQPAGPPPAPRHYRTVWLSDVHLGLADCRADLLLEFLAVVRCDTLYLVGDIIDFWKLKAGGKWTPLHGQVIQRLMAIAAQGTRVVYIPGNHDDVLRDYFGQSFGGLELQPRVSHRCADGRRLLILHGDEFDSVVTHNRWLSMLGGELYDFALRLNRLCNAMRQLVGLPYWSLSAFLKGQVKKAVQYIGKFEQVVINEARRLGVDGVVCGHIHHPAIQQLDGITYYNDGDWVESCTALVENAAGKLELIHWPSVRQEWLQPQAEAPYASRAHHRRLVTAD